MKLWETFRYEFAYQIRSGYSYFYFVLLLVISFLLAAFVFTDEPLSGGYYLNAPFIIAKVSVISFFLLGLLVLASIAGKAATRDYESRMYPLLYTSPISKAVYLGGRMLAVFAFGSIMMFSIPAGVYLAHLFPMNDAGLMGPANSASYIQTYFIFLLPNTFFSIAMMFATAILNRKGMLSYLTAILIGMITISSWQYFGAQQSNWTLANLADPLGLTILQELKAAWTSNQKNTLQPGMEWSVILNRNLWFVFSAAILFLTYVRFKKSEFSTTQTKNKRSNQVDPSCIQNLQHKTYESIKISELIISFDIQTRIDQLVIIAKESFRVITYGWGWIAIAIMFLFVLLTGQLWFSDYYNIPELPVTGNLLNTMQNLSDHGIWFIIPVLIIYYSGELVWRERDNRLNDIIGAAPVPAWVLFTGKLSGMILALVIIQTVCMIAGMLLQVKLGYYDFEVDVYLKILFGLRLVNYVLLAIFAFTVHILINHKYAAHLITTLYYLFTVLGPGFGIKLGLLMYGSDPGWTFSEIRGLNPYMKPWLYFKLYWFGWAILFIVIIISLWPRGRERSILKKFELGIREKKIQFILVSSIFAAWIIGFGSFIYYQTYILFPKTNLNESSEWKANYEKQYYRYADNLQPAITRVKIEAEIYPESGTADFNGSYILKNKTNNKIDTLFISTSPQVIHHQITWSRKINAQQFDEVLNFGIYILENPLSPGDSMELGFQFRYEPLGFPDYGMKTAVTQNGTYFEDGWLPVIGFDNSRQIFNATERKIHGLQAKSFLESENEFYARQHVDFEAVIGTDIDQTAVAPGKLINSWTENNRSYYHYATENPINYKFAFFSSRYHLYNESWRSDSNRIIDIRIFHHPKHIYNLERIGQGIQASFNYLNTEYGNYPHSEITFLEVPGYNKGLHAFPTNVFYREGFALLKPDKDPRGFDMVFATVAHEVAHQWWGHQVTPAPIKGAALITESLAWFSAFEIIEQSLGNDQLLTLLEMARDDYYSPQERDADPLLQAGQTNLIYRKGPLALYALRKYIGRDNLRKGLKNFFTQYNRPGISKPVPSDLYRELKKVTPDTLSFLLNDLFATNTFWDLRTEHAAAYPDKSGRWKIKLNVRARKFTVDKNGKQTDIPMNDWIEIGAFNDGSQGLVSKINYQQKHLISSGLQEIVIEVEGKPSVAAIDPNKLLIDLKTKDNQTTIKFPE